MKARYLHTNLIAHEWRRLALFYQELFGCVPVPPERDLHGASIDAGTGVTGSRITGIHLRLPGFGIDGPTLEIFQYSRLETDAPRAVNRPGFAHIAFSVDSVEEFRARALSLGGHAIGEVVDTVIDSRTRITWCYVTDPEGNILELQSRSES